MFCIFFLKLCTHIDFKVLSFFFQSLNSTNGTKNADVKIMKIYELP